MALAVDAAVHAARAADVAEFDEALSALAVLDREQVAVLLGEVARDLIERVHPDGLDSDDASALLDACARSAGFYASFDERASLVALMGALGVVAVPDEGTEQPVPAGSAVVAHGLLLIASLVPRSGASLPDVLDAALRELMRAQTVEMP